VEHEDGSGRPEPQDRIDFVLHRGLTVLDSRALVTGTPRSWPDVAGNDWPSDHAAVVTTFVVPRAVPSPPTPPSDPSELADRPGMSAH
jgi:hypothetical protein